MTPENKRPELRLVRGEKGPIASHEVPKSSPLPPLATVAPRGVHTLPGYWEHGKHMIVAVTSTGYFGQFFNVSTEEERDEAIAACEEYLRTHDPREGVSPIEQAR